MLNLSEYCLMLLTLALVYKTNLRKTINWTSPFPTHPRISIFLGKLPKQYWWINNIEFHWFILLVQGKFASTFPQVIQRHYFFHRAKHHHSWHLFRPSFFFLLIPILPTAFIYRLVFFSWKLIKSETRGFYKRTKISRERQVKLEILKKAETKSIVFQGSFPTNFQDFLKKWTVKD